MVNYTAGAIVGNDTVVKLNQGASLNELSVYSFANTHLVGDIVGYYIAPAPTPLQCEEQVSATQAVAAGGTAAVSTPACSVGYTINSGGCVTASNFDGRVVSTRTFPGTNTHFCAVRNEGVGSMNFTAYSICCRVPGR